MAAKKDFGFDFSTFDDIINGIDSSTKTDSQKQKDQPDSLNAERLGIDEGLMQDI